MISTEDPGVITAFLSGKYLKVLYLVFGSDLPFLGVIYLADADGRPILQSHTLSLLQMFDSVANDDCSSHSLNRMTQEWQRRRAVMI